VSVALLALLVPGGALPTVAQVQPAAVAALAPAADHARVAEAQQIINDMHVSFIYIYIGKLERTVYPSEGIGKFEQMVEQG